MTDNARRVRQWALDLSAPQTLSACDWRDMLVIQDMKHCPESETIFSRDIIHMVPRGLEPRTLRLLAVRSNQLSYETK